MKSLKIRRNILRILGKVVFFTLFAVWSTGMLTGGAAGLVAVAVGIPVSIGMTIFS